MLRRLKSSGESGSGKNHAALKERHRSRFNIWLEWTLNSPEIGAAFGVALKRRSGLDSCGMFLLQARSRVYVLEFQRASSSSIHLVLRAQSPHLVKVSINNAGRNLSGLLHFFKL